MTGEQFVFLLALVTFAFGLLLIWRERVNAERRREQAAWLAEHEAAKAKRQQRRDAEAARKTAREWRAPERIVA